MMLRFRSSVASWAALALILLGLCASCAGAGTSGAAAGDQVSFSEQVSLDAKPADAYVVDKFLDHDIVFLGERHYVGQYLEFMQSLIPGLYRAGVHNLGYEMVNAKEQANLDRYLMGEYDDAYADRLVFDWRLDHMAYRDYADVLRAARTFNRSLPQGARPFRILALDVATHATEWSQLRPGERGDPDRKAMERHLGGEWSTRRDILWAEILVREVLNKGEKALVYAGAGHTPTRYANIVGNGHDLRAGNLIYNYIGDRALRILMHAGSREQIQINQKIEALAADLLLPDSKVGIGFDVELGTEIGDLPVASLGYLPESSKFGAPQMHDLKFAHVTDGLVFLAPQSEFRMVQAMEATPEMLEEYNRREQIRTGDKPIEYSLQDLQSKITENYRRRLGDRSN